MLGDDVPVLCIHVILEGDSGMSLALRGPVAELARPCSESRTLRKVQEATRVQASLLTSATASVLPQELRLLGRFWVLVVSGVVSGALRFL